MNRPIEIDTKEGFSNAEWIIQQLQEERDALLEENQRLAQIINEPELVEFSMKRGEAAMFEYEHWAVRLLAASFAESLRNAENFIVMECSTKEGEKLFVTIQRANGKTPAELYSRIKQENRILLESMALCSGPCGKSGEAENLLNQYLETNNA